MSIRYRSLEPLGRNCLDINAPVTFELQGNDLSIFVSDYVYFMDSNGII